MSLSYMHFLVLGGMIFVIAMLGLFLRRKNLMVILMCVELMLLAVVINFLTFSVMLNDISGQAYSLFLLTIAGAESAIGLAVIMVYFRKKGSIATDDIRELKG